MCFAPNTHYRCKIPCRPVCVAAAAVHRVHRLLGATRPRVAGAADSITAPGRLSAAGRPALICHRRRQTALSADTTATRLSAVERTAAAMLMAEKRSRRRQRAEDSHQTHCVGFHQRAEGSRQKDLVAKRQKLAGFGSSWMRWCRYSISNPPPTPR